MDTYYVIPITCAMNNKALSLFFIPPFEQLPTCFLVNISRTSRSCLLYMVYIFVITFTFSGAISLKMILTTEEVITATIKVISATTKVNLTTEEVITTTLNII